MAFGFTGLLFQPFWLRKVCRIHYPNNGKGMAHLLLINYHPTRVVIADLGRKENKSIRG